MLCLALDFGRLGRAYIEISAAGFLSPFGPVGTGMENFLQPEFIFESQAQ